MPRTPRKKPPPQYGIAVITARVEAFREKFRAPPCRTLADMSEAEIRALEAQYGCPVQRPG